MKLISFLKLVELVMICTWSSSNPESVRNLKQSKKRRQSLKLPVLSYCSVDCIFFLPRPRYPCRCGLVRVPGILTSQTEERQYLIALRLQSPKCRAEDLLSFVETPERKDQTFHCYWAELSHHKTVSSWWLPSSSTLVPLYPSIKLAARFEEV